MVVEPVGGLSAQQMPGQIEVADAARNPDQPALPGRHALLAPGAFEPIFLIAREPQRAILSISRQPSLPGLEQPLRRQFALLRIEQPDEDRSEGGCAIAVSQITCEGEQLMTNAAQQTGKRIGIGRLQTEMHHHPAQRDLVMHLARVGGNRFISRFDQVPPSLRNVGALPRQIGDARVGILDHPRDLVPIVVRIVNLRCHVVLLAGQTAMIVEVEGEALPEISPGEQGRCRG